MTALPTCVIPKSSLVAGSPSPRSLLIAFLFEPPIPLGKSYSRVLVHNLLKQEIGVLMRMLSS
jgi:hypothetical protein